MGCSFPTDNASMFEAELGPQFLLFKKLGRRAGIRFGLNVTVLMWSILLTLVHPMCHGQFMWIG